jgi:hypothetical protein
VWPFDWATVQRNSLEDDLGPGLSRISWQTELPMQLAELIPALCTGTVSFFQVSPKSIVMAAAPAENLLVVMHAPPIPQLTATKWGAGSGASVVSVHDTPPLVVLYSWEDADSDSPVEAAARHRVGVEQAKPRITGSGSCASRNQWTPASVVRNNDIVRFELSTEPLTNSA